MPDPDTDLAQVTPPDLWPEIESRISRLPRRRRGTSHRVVAAIIAIVAASAASILFWEASGLRTSRSPGGNAEGEADVTVHMVAPAPGAANAFPSAIVGIGFTQLPLPLTPPVRWSDHDSGYVITTQSLVLPGWLPPSATLVVTGDATGIRLYAAALRPDSAGPEKELTGSHGNFHLPSEPGQYVFRLVGTWAKGTAGFSFTVHIQDTHRPGGVSG
jgi:hypothetical protein